MKAICQQCHGNSWIDDFYDGFDKAVEEYNDVYFKPVKNKMDELYEKGLVDKTKYFDEHLELQYYETLASRRPTGPHGRDDDGAGLCLVAWFLRGQEPL